MILHHSPTHMQQTLVAQPQAVLADAPGCSLARHHLPTQRLYNKLLNTFL